VHPKFQFIGSPERYQWCEEVARTMVALFAIPESEAIAKISEYWGGLDFSDSMDIHLHETHKYWARVFYYDGNPPGDPREP